MLGSHRLHAIIEVRHLATKLHDGWMVVFALCTGSLYFLTYAASPSDYMKNMEYTDDRKFIEVYVFQNCRNR